jgi:hypothetical protein
MSSNQNIRCFVDGRPARYGHDDYGPTEDCIPLADRLGPAHGVVGIDFQRIILQLPGNHAITRSSDSIARNRIRMWRRAQKPEA